MSISLYVHIPFCIKKCIYCDFVSGAYDPEKASRYIDALKMEISGLSANRPLSTLYIGGGTPTALEAEQLSGLIEHIFKHFTLSPPLSEGGTWGGEATIEANPGTVDIEQLKRIRKAGMNRISIGVQSFNNNELGFLGRIHNSEEAEEAVKLARDAGFRNLGIDLIYGIPGQSMASWKGTLQKAAGLKPDHISTYELTVEEGTGLHKLLNSTAHPHPSLGKGEQMGGNISRVDEDLTIEMYENTISMLEAEGYHHYEISNFSLPGCRSRHNLNYWDRGEYFGAGAGAHSFINNIRSRNTADLSQYLKALKEHSSPVEHTEEISPEKALSEAIFLGLRKTGGIDVEKLAKRYGINILTRYEKEINELREAGLISTGASECSYETNIRLTRKGLILSNEVFVKFI